MKRLLDILDHGAPSPAAEVLATRYRGAMLGLAAGNVLGLPVESHSRALIARRTRVRGGRNSSVLSQFQNPASGTNWRFSLCNQRLMSALC